MDIVVRDAGDGDVTAIARIQNAFIDSTTIDWRDEPYSVDDRRAWLERHRAGGRPVLVAEIGGAVVGFAAYGDFRDTARWPGYRGTVEHTVHVDAAHWDSGAGRALVEALCERAAAAGVHAIVAGIDGDNHMSIRFHERVGFVHVGRLPEVGRGHGRWLDLVLMQRILPGTGPAD
jgi:phosphinothricin acetyltransferase